MPMRDGGFELSWAEQPMFAVGSHCNVLSKGTMPLPFLRADLALSLKAAGGRG